MLKQAVLIEIAVTSVAQAAETYSCTIEYGPQGAQARVTEVPVIVNNPLSKIGTMAQLNEVQKMAIASITSPSPTSQLNEITLTFTALDAEGTSSADDFLYSVAAKGQPTISLSGKLGGVSAALECELSK